MFQTHTATYIYKTSKRSQQSPYRQFFRLIGRVEKHPVGCHGVDLPWRRLGVNVEIMLKKRDSMCAFPHPGLSVTLTDLD